MNRKAIAIALIGLMAISAIGMMPVKVKAGVADNMQGGNLNVYGYNDILYYDGSNYRGNITGLDISTGAITHAYNAGGEVNDGDYYSDGNYWCEYRWDATSAKYGWKPSAPAAGDTLVVVSEIPANGLGDASGSNPQNAMGSGNGINYTYATVYQNVQSSDSNVAPDQYEWYGRYEPIPNYDSATTTAGDNWINISIPLPKYTDWDDSNGVVHHRGTFDVWKSYAVFMVSPDDNNYNNGTGSYDGWYFVGNASNVVAGPGAPLPAYEQGAPTDPSTIDTGHAYLNITGLQKESRYYFMIRMNFDFGSNHGGYGGGLGSYTTYVSSGASSTAVVTTPEYTTILVPIVATIGMFMVATYFYRKRD